MQILDFVLRLGAALLMGAVVGLERQWRQRMAGTRMNALVSAGASSFVMCAFMVRDTSRSEAQIVSYVDDACTPETHSLKERFCGSVPALA